MVAAYLQGLPIGWRAVRTYRSGAAATSRCLTGSIVVNKASRIVYLKGAWDEAFRCDEVGRKVRE